MTTLLDKAKENIDNFHNCTHLNIEAYTENGSLLFSLGNPVNAKIHRILERIHDKKNIININKKQNTFITICPIIPNDYTYGFYVIGPYSTEKNNIEDILYKPIHCLPHLIQLLYVNIEVKEESHNLNVTKAIKYIDSHYSEDINLDVISKELNLNKTYFCNVFRKTKKKTVIGYLNEKRIEKGKELLVNTDMSIADIALSIGYSNQNYFNTVFKKKENMTPLEFRNKYKNI